MSSCGGDDIPFNNEGSGNGNENKPEVVEPTYSFTSPCIEWGKSKDIVKQYMKDFELIYENDTLLVYLGNQKTETCIGYNFKDEKLYMAGVDIPGSMVENSSKLKSNTFSGYYVLTKDKDNDKYYKNEIETIGYFSSHTGADNNKYYSCTWMHGVLMENQ